VRVPSTRIVSPAATLCVAVLTALTAIALASTARAQFGGNTTYDAAKNAYFVNGSAILSSNVSGNNIFVGKDDATNFATQTGSYTLGISAGATTTGKYNSYPDGKFYNGVNVFGNHNVAISGGDVSVVAGHDDSTTGISGGSIVAISGYNASTTNISGGYMYYDYGYNTNVTNISGGTVSQAEIYNSSTLNIRGGTVDYAFGFDTTTTNMSGGSISKYILLTSTTSTVNFVGTGLSFAYQGYGTFSPFVNYADQFRVTGIIGGVPSSVNVYLSNAARENGKANSTQRQFTFSAPVVVPEAGSLALLLPALGVLGAFVAVRRQK